MTDTEVALVLPEAGKLALLELAHTAVAVLPSEPPKSATETNERN